MANEKRLIDANALLEEIQFRRPVIDTETKIVADCVAIARKAIVNAPTVDAVEVVHGEWLYGERNKVERTLIVECSECGAMFNLPMFTFGMNYNYCPNCGAKMDGDGNGYQV